MHMIAGVLQYVAVASFAEAWIEKYMGGSYVCLAESPPSRRRGLKNEYDYGMPEDHKSPPSRRRGLKIDRNDIPVESIGRLLRGGVD